MILYHNPRCSKSRQALALLQEKNIQVQVKLYLKDGVDADEVVALSKALGMPVSLFEKGRPNTRPWEPMSSRLKNGRTSLKMPPYYWSVPFY